MFKLRDKLVPQAFVAVTPMLPFIVEPWPWLIPTVILLPDGVLVLSKVIPGRRVQLYVKPAIAVTLYVTVFCPQTKFGPLIAAGIPGGAVVTVTVTPPDELVVPAQGPAAPTARK